MHTRLPKRQVLLFLLVLATPCLVLTGLGLRLREQERDLARRHAAEERQQRLSQFRTELLTVLERIKQHAVKRRGADAVLVATVTEGRLILPFADETQDGGARRTLQHSTFGARVGNAEREEVVAQRLDKAEEMYRRAITESAVPWERAYGGLLLARTLRKAGKAEEARKWHETVLRAPASLTDEYGMPLALYAAAPLLDPADRQSGVAEVLRRLLEDPRQLPPFALRRIRDLAGQAGEPKLIPAVDRLIAEREQAEALQADLPRLLPRLQSDDPVWVPYGDPVWLLSLAPGNGGETVLVGVVMAKACGAVGRPAAGIRLAQGKDGEPLGAGFPGLRAILPGGTQNGELGTAFRTFALGLVMALTLLAGYLLWRDVQRNARLAELRSHFVSSVSHELRTPLTSIRMFSETLRMDDEMDVEQRAGYVEAIVGESERLSRLVDNMLHFARMEQGRAAYDLRPASLTDIVDAAVRSFAFLASKNGFDVRVEAAEELPPVLADRDALQQAILNLLGNALKYSGTSREIVLRLERENGRAAIHVIDHGVGIAPEEHGRIFERFYRVATPENRQIPGTGLGLTLVSHIAAAHGGSVSVESAPGSGSRFTIRIPFSEQA